MSAIRSKRWAGWAIAGLTVAALVVVAAGPIYGWTAAHRAGLAGSEGLRPLIRAVTSPFFLRMAAIAGGSLAAIIGLFVLLARAGRRPFDFAHGGQQEKRESLARNESGTAMVEFALVLPIATAVVLLLVQSMLLMGGSVVVNYAAAAAARAAIVWIPRDLSASTPSEPVDTVVDGDQSAKRNMIQLAAAVALLPVAGISPADADPTNGVFAPGVKQYFSNQNVAPPGWTVNFLTGKLNYAWAHTTVTLRPGQTAADVYQPNEDLTVLVQHALVLPVPYANMLFQDGSVANVGYTSSVSASCTLNNEGVDSRILEDVFH
jgi:prepilin-type processing-associated H-X9-DG protein